MSVPSVALSSRRWRSWLPWISALVLVVGVVTFVVVFNVGGLRNTSKQSKVTLSNQPAQQVKNLGPHVPLPNAARLVAARWIRGAVGRTDLEGSWRLTAPNLKQNLTLAQWKTGAIPVVPYPIGKAVSGIVRINWSTKNDVSFEVTLVPKKGAGIKAQDFFINLRTAGTGKNRHWLVYYWAPRAIAPVPDASESR